MRLRTQFFTALAALAMLSGPVSAEEPAALAEELRALRQLVEQQSKQIDTLSKQVEKLTAVVEGRTAAKSDAVSKIEPIPKVEASPKAEAEPAPEPAAPSEDTTANAPKAELAGNSKHIIQKGETLTSIAKHYNIPLADLQKANKDVNPAKLQIGQAINIPPTPSGKNPEPTPDKKETR